HLTFGSSDSRMRFRRVIKDSPGDEPQKSERTCDDECRSPATEVFVQADYKQWSDCSTNRRTAVKKRYCPATFSFRKPLRDSFRCGGPICRFTCAEKKPEEGKATQTA